MASPEEGASEQRLMSDRAFDSYLELRATPDGVPLASNDDRGDRTLNSRIIFTAPSARDYYIVARPLGGTGGGDYVLVVHRLPPPPSPIRLTEATVRGELGERSGVGEFYGSAARYSVYVFDGVQGERVQIDVSSNNVQRAVELVGPDGRTLAQDVGLGQLNARILAALPNNGRYTVRVQAPANETTQYILQLRRGSAAQLARPQALAVGQRVEGAFSLESQATESANQELTFYAIYALDLNAGQAVAVRVDANGFVPIVEGGTMTVLGFDPVTRSAMGENATLMLYPVEAGTAYVRVRTSEPATGTYSLTATSERPAPMR